MSSKLEFERDTHVRVTAMSAQGARDFFGGAWFKTICLGQALADKYRFGARTYLLFRTEADWNKYRAEKSAEASS